MCCLPRFRRERHPLTSAQSTPISKIMNAFRTTYGIGAEKDVFLLFDGERLERSARVDETDLSDMDSIEVHIR